MAVSNEQVFNWLQANPNATDAEIAAVASAAGVSAQQLSEVTSVPVQQIAARLAAPDVAPAPSPAPTPASVDSVSVVDTLASQILSQGTVNQWSGEGFGSAEANAKDMAKILADIGVTDIKQFGKVDKLERVEQFGFTHNGQTVQNPSPGVFYVQEPQYDGEGGIGSFIPRYLSSEEAKQIKPTYAVVEDDGEGGKIYSPVDSSTVKIKDGETVAVTGQTFGNKVTGQEVPRTYDSDTTAWGGTYAGKGNTGYRAEFAPDGTPYFYTTAGSSKDKLLSTLAPAIGLGLMFIPGMQGIGASIGSVVAPTLSASAQSIIGNAIIKGTLAEAQGGEFFKTALLSSVGDAASSYAGELGSTLGVTDPAIAKIVGSSIISGAASSAANGDFVTGAVSGALSAGGGQLLGETIGLDGRIASSVGTSLVNGVVAKLQGTEATDAMIAGAISGALTYKPTTEYSGITNRVVDEAIPQGYVPPTNDDEFDVSKIIAGATFEKPDYSLTTGMTFPSTEGLKVEPITNAGSTVGYSPVDYGFNAPSGLGLKMPTSPNVDSMGGGQGITIQTPTGELSQSGITLTGTASNLGDSNSIINKDAPDTSKESSISPKDAFKIVANMMGIATAGATLNKITSTTAPKLSANIEYGDIYKDAPIKGFSMRKGEGGRYTPFIGEKAQLAKGGFISKKESKPTPTGLASRRT